MNTETEITDAYGYELEGAELNKARNVIRFIDMMKKGFRASKNKWMRSVYDECTRWTKFKSLEAALLYQDPSCIWDTQKDIADFQNELIEKDSNDERLCYDWYPVEPYDVVVTQEMMEEMFAQGTYEGCPFDRFVVREGNNEVYYVKK